MRLVGTFALSVVVGTSLLSSFAAAQTTSGIAFEIPDINKFVGGGVGLAPDYLGSDDTL